MNQDNKIHKKSIKKIDAIVTGMLLWGIVASIYGIKKTADKHAELVSTQKEEEKEGNFKKILKLLIFWVQKPKVEKKTSLFSIFKK